MGDGPRGAVFVSGACVLGQVSMIDLMMAWAVGRSNETYLRSRIGEARSELSRGTDHDAVMRSVMSLFRGVPRADLESVAAGFVRRRTSPAWRSKVPCPASGAPPCHTVLVTELVLFPDDRMVHGLGVDHVLCSIPASSRGRLTGEVVLLREPVARLQAAQRCAAATGVSLAASTVLGTEANDLALLRAAGRAVIVGDDPVLAAAADAAGLRTASPPGSP